MIFRTAEGEYINPQKGRIFYTGGVRYPQLILVKWESEGTLFTEHGARVATIGPKADERWYINTPVEDLNTPGVVTVTFTSAARYTSTELRTQIEDLYYSNAGPLAVQIERQLALWNVIRPGAAVTNNWLAAQADMLTRYDNAVTAFQAAMALGTEQLKYEALITIFNDILTIYLPDVSTLKHW